MIKSAFDPLFFSSSNTGEKKESLYLLKSRPASSSTLISVKSTTSTVRSTRNPKLDLMNSGKNIRIHTWSPFEIIKIIEREAEIEKSNLRLLKNILKIKSHIDSASTISLPSGGNNNGKFTNSPRTKEVQFTSNTLDMLRRQWSSVHFKK